MAGFRRFTFTNSLKERLKTHSTAFNGLLSLIPAKYYYDEATQDQWQKKKKAKKEASEDRIAKLDPESAVTADSYNTNGASAKDIMDNRAKTAKKVSLPRKHINKNLEVEAEPETESSDAEVPEKTDSEELIKGTPQMEFDDEGNELILDNTPAANRDQQKSKKKELSPEEKKLREQRRADLKEKLAKKINILREKRKAPGTKTGGPVKSREQMLTERKRREELKKQEKLKRKRDEVDDDDEESDKSDDDDEDEDAKDDEDPEVLFGNIQFADGSRMTSDLKTIRNGVDQKKKKGPANKDIKAHLTKLEAKRRKLELLTPEERKQLEEKDQWSSLMSQAEGVKVKNDEKLLKKALKKKEKQKLKSEIEWRERKQVVKDTISARQKRREANLKARKDNKGKKSKNQPKLRKFTGVVKKGKGGKDGKKRAGFEGNAKSKGKQQLKN